MKMGSAADSDRSLLPFLVKTWSGRLVLINAVVFVWMSLASDSFMLPTPEVLDLFGAKDVVAIAQGEWWRLLSAMFLHIGLVHFLFNSYAIYVIGPQIESLVGPKWFLALYLISGVVGNICSSLYSVSISAGASGAILGLLGCGLYIELLIRRQMQRWTGKRPRAGAYLINTIGIVILGALIPNIDNAAHFGGLAAGYIFGYALLLILPNRLRPQSSAMGYRIFAMLAISAVVAAIFAANPNLVVERYRNAASQSGDYREKIFLCTRALELAPGSAPLHLERGVALIVMGNLTLGMADLARATDAPDFSTRVEQLRSLLLDHGRIADAAALESFLDQMQMSPG